jgi:anti-sigma-K factor RskA
MEIFIFSILMAASGSFVTSIGCRRAQSHHRRPGWHLIFLATVVTALLAMLYVGQADLFRPARWDEHKGGTSGFWRPVIFASEAAAVISGLSSLAVFFYFRARYRDVKSVA